MEVLVTLAPAVEVSLEWVPLAHLAGSVMCVWYATTNTRVEAVLDVAQKCKGQISN